MSLIGTGREPAAGSLGLRFANPPGMTKVAFLLATVLVATAACQQDNQVAGPDGRFDSVKITSGGGFVPAKQAADECDPGDAAVITADAVASSVTWNLCRHSTSLGHMVVVSGTRSATSAELGSIRAALLQVQIGNRGMCGADKGLVTLDVTREGSTGRYVDDFYGCQPAPEGRTFVTNIDAAANALFALVPTPE